MLQKKQTIIGLSLALAALAAVILAFSSLLGTQGPPITSQSDSFRLDLQKGKTLSYTLHYRSSGHADFSLPSSQGSGPSQHQAIDVNVVGLLQLQVTDLHKEHTTLAFSLKPEQWTYAVEQGASSFQPARIDGQLQLGHDASIRAFHMDPEAYQRWGLLIADILRLIDVSFPQNGDETWRAWERGFEEASPLRFAISDRSGAAWLLTKSYEPIPKPGSSISGEGQLRFHSQDYLTSAHVLRKRESLRQPATRASDTTELRLDVLRDAPHFVSTAPLDGRSVRETLDGKAYQQLAATMMHRGRLGNLRWEDLQSLLEGLEADNPQANVETFMLLRSYIFLHPEGLDILLPYLSERSYDDPRCATLAAALTAIGSEAAQKLLMAALDRVQMDQTTRERLIPHLSLMKDLGPEAEAYLYQLATSEGEGRVKGTAELSIGVMGSHFTEPEHAARRTKALTFAKGILDEAQDEKEIDHALRILGNIGDPEQMPWIEPFLNHSDLRVRQAAVEALRDVDDPKAATILFDLLKGETKDEIRVAAVKSLGKAIQQDDALPLLKAQLLREGNTLIAQGLISHLLTLAPRHPEIKPFLEDYIAQCGKTEICSFASSALNSI